MDNLNRYFTPINSNLLSDIESLESTQLGLQVDFHTKNNFPELKQKKIVLFSIGEYEGSKNNSDNIDNLRAVLYKLHHAKSLEIADLGSVRLMPTRKESFGIIEEICSVLIKNSLFPIIIGGGNDISYAVYKAYARIKKFITLTAVDTQFDLGLHDNLLSSHSYLSKIIQYKPSYLFHYVNLAYQSYYVSPKAVELISDLGFESIRLGEISADISCVEPIIRNTDFLSFDLSAIKHSYFPANVYSSPNGLDGEDACKIMRYAGVSDKVSCLGFFEYNQELDNYNQSALLLSQMIWYFLDGYSIRKNELNPDLKNCVKYTVPFEDGKNEIVFYKSKLSGRWWMGVPFVNKNDKSLDNYFVACSYYDYEIATKGDIPERWIKTYNKFV